ncbi:MAG: hypothetical protein EOS22_28775 [Mesorhizobium sp.]|uniref:hypothetical protein n=1 Tax=Mesorhizobium sp. TaxID=1871066 RepID=UPI000FE97A88|nr:hypothetical protein [Mesorhizobium sp.]RWD21769.1 MAG: hypothetical protein EOS22_28775 [Mesorhizobium sp.]TJW68056.1 MAG: hypothetical protein E5V29_14640 [Mesorhizobium sp.]
MAKLWISFFCSLLWPLSSSAFAADCDTALVIATYSKVDFAYSDWRSARNVSQGQYDTIKQSAGANAVIYGVPMGADWSRFQQNIKTLSNNSNESLTKQSFTNIAWTGLDDNSLAAYQACLKEEAASQRRAVSIIPERATKNEVTFRVIYNPSGKMPNPIKVKWSGSAAKRAKGLPKSLTADTQLITVRRPKPGGDDEQLIVNAAAAGAGDVVVLTALPKTIPPEDRLAAECNISETSDPLPSFGVPGSANWACPLPTQAGQYRVTVSIKPTADSPLRANYSLALVVAKLNGESATLDITQANQMDTIEGPNLLNPNFYNNGGTYSLPAGKVTFQVNVSSSANHCCFDTSGGRDGSFTMPKAVTLRLEKL